MKETSPVSVAKLINTRPPAVRRVVDLFWNCLVILIAHSIEGAESSNGAIGSGMVLKDMVIPLSISEDAIPVVLSAREAKTLNPTHLLRLERAKSVFGDRSGGQTSIHVKNAVFDSLNKKIISLHETDFLFDASNALNNDHKVSLVGREIDSNSYQVESSNSKLHDILGDGVDASGFLFVEFKTHETSLFLQKKDPVVDAANDFFTLKIPLDSVFFGPPTRLKLVQQACVSLADFYKCWPLVEGTKNGRMGCFTKNGGRLATLEKGVTINGPAVILSELIVLAASDGIFLRRKLLDDHGVMETHVLANNGANALISDGRGDVAIKCESFKHIIETKTSQFEGGPVVMQRNNVTLVAEEQWQFVRVFDYHRVVLSPGKWQVVGTLNPNEARSHR